MTSAALTATAAALLSWPGNQAPARLKALTATGTTRHWPRPNPAVLIATAVVTALVTFGVGLALAVTIAALTVRARWRARTRTRDRIAAIESIADAIHGLTAELRAGAHPVAAAESAARDATEPAATILRTIASTTRLDGDLTRLLDRYPIPTLRPLITAWRVAENNGVPLGAVLEAVRADVTGRIRFIHQVRARMAGPRASGAVLAGLPALGVVLGETMGAQPVHVLLTNPFGQAMLVIGTALVCLGLRWIDKLTSQAVLP